MHRVEILDLREAGETRGIHHVAKIMKLNNIQALHCYQVPRIIQGRPSIYDAAIAQRPQDRNSCATVYAIEEIPLDALSID